MLMLSMQKHKCLMILSNKMKFIPLPTVQLGIWIHIPLHAPRECAVLETLCIVDIAFANANVRVGLLFRCLASGNGRTDS